MMTRALEKIAVFFLIYGKTTSGKKKKKEKKTKGLKLFSCPEEHVPTCEGNICCVLWTSATFSLHLCHMTVLNTSPFGEVAWIPDRSWRQESLIHIYIAA